VLRFWPNPDCFLVPEEALNNVERVLNLGANAGLELLDLFAQPPVLGVRQRLAFAGSQGDMPYHDGVLIFLALLAPLIAGITKSAVSSPCKRAMRRKCGMKQTSLRKGARHSRSRGTLSFAAGIAWE